MNGARLHGALAVVGPEGARLLQVDFEEAEVVLSQKAHQPGINLVIVEPVHQVHAAGAFVHITLQLVIQNLTHQSTFSSRGGTRFLAMFVNNY